MTGMVQFDAELFDVVYPNLAATVVARLDAVYSRQEIAEIMTGNRYAYEPTVSKPDLSSE